jgi:hypothetical protein
MLAVACRRREIYDYFHASAACQRYFHDATHEAEYVAYYTSMYLMQDTTESMLTHRRAGFSTDPLRAYLEFWGVMQAAIIQQDAIAEIYNVVLGRPLNAADRNLKAWLEVRNLRNLCAGHPAKKTLPRSEPLSRTFMGRAFGGYESLTYEQWQHGAGTSHPRVPLGLLLNAYAREAEAELAAVLLTMKKRWP